MDIDAFKLKKKEIKEMALSVEKVVVSNQYPKEEEYWLNRFSSEFSETHFPYDFTRIINEYVVEKYYFSLTGEIFSNLMKLSNGSNIRLHIALVASLSILLNRYTENNDIIVGIPIYKQEVDGEFINTELALRIILKGNMPFKKFLKEVRQTIIEANENQNYPIEMLIQKLNIEKFFDVGILLEDIHDRRYLRYTKPNIIFYFSNSDKLVKGILEYNSSVYEHETIERIISHFKKLMSNILSNINTNLTEINILTEEEKKQLIFDFNNTHTQYPSMKTIHNLIEEKAEKVPNNIAVTFENTKITYKNLNERANQLSFILRKKGVSSESIVAIIMERSIAMIVSLLAILKAGGTYLPIDYGFPVNRILYMIENAGVKVLFTTSNTLKNLSFTSLQNIEHNHNTQIIVTPTRKNIDDIDTLPIPDRSLINLKKYRNKIGMASVTNCISFLTTRGCPYNCLYCHKIWSKNHVYRSAENIYNEIEYYYKNGVTNFAVIDDCFNVNHSNSRRLFKHIIKNNLKKIRLFFPNGLRGDILTPDFIDLMIEAGTCGINLSLETASPRLQQLLKKNLDLDKFYTIAQYIASKRVIFEMATMHGFPTETEEEAMMTLNFIKDIKWLHFPYIHILKIFPNTEMEKFALEHGVSKDDILISKDRAFHELPETLPFSKSFTRQYQAIFMNEYFLSKERLRHVLPIQMEIFNEEAFCQKYNSYLPIEVNKVTDIFKFAQINNMYFDQGAFHEQESDNSIFDVEHFNQDEKSNAKKILLLDLSQHFSFYNMIYNVTEQPLGLISLLTYLKERLGDKIDGRVWKSRIDFDSFEELKILVESFNPDFIGIRTLTFFKDFFHEAVSLLRQWGIDAPIITGGPYASSDYNTILKDKNIDLVVIGEGEYTLYELIYEMLKIDFKMPDHDTLKKIKGLAFAEDSANIGNVKQIILFDHLPECKETENLKNPESITDCSKLAYVMYTSGSTGTPKGVMVEHRQVNNCIFWMQDKFNLNEKDVIVQRTNLTFDPSVWEIFWPLYIGGCTRILSENQSKDAEFLIKLMTENEELTIMYCPATLLNEIASHLDKKKDKSILKLPYLLIGAETIDRNIIDKFYNYYVGKIINTYGPTECTINNTYYECERDVIHSVVPIGKPISNNKIYILSQELNLVPLKVNGEICIAGDSVGRGYINDPEITYNNFINNPFGKGNLYKTGDIGRWDIDGNIEILNRIDNQIKLRGYRIEPVEIKSALLSHTSIDDCALILKDIKDIKGRVNICKICGITSNYPNIRFISNDICEICENLREYKKSIEKYFKTLEDLKQLIRNGNKNRKEKYDCLLVYACERVATYALYKLVEMGFNVLTATYDTGYISKSTMENIKRITKKIGVDHIVLTHKKSDQILKESLRKAQTMCKGCIHTSTALAGEYAYKNNIKFVIGETLSRGQIIENKLYKFLKQGISSIKEIEDETINLQKSAINIDETIFNYIDIDIIKNKILYDRVKFIDFYRYCHITNKELITYLNRKDPYWKTLNTNAIYSTNCIICKVGDYHHFQKKGYHYNGGAKSWEKRLGLISIEELNQELESGIDKKDYMNFLIRLGCDEDIVLDKDDKYLCAFYVSDKQFSTSELRNYLLGKLPIYMIPSFFVHLKEIPLNSDGKIDRQALSKLEIKPKTEYTAPKNEIEKELTRIWADVLRIEPCKISIHDNFFELGGDSVSAIQIIARSQEIVGVELPLQNLFESPSIADFAANIARIKEVVQKIQTIPDTPENKREEGEI